MTVNDVLIRVRQYLGDMQKIKYSDEELIYALNNAINKTSIEAANNKIPEFMKEFTIEAGEDVPRPEDFVDFQGQYPIMFSVKGNKVICRLLDQDYDGEMTVRYFAMRPSVSTLDDEVPFWRTWQLDKLVDATIMEVQPGAASPASSENAAGSSNS